MNKKEVIAFFDERAKQWDAYMIKDAAKIKQILDVAGVSEGCRVLDVATGTGVLIPDYLERKVGSVVAFDISPNMIAVAEEKFRDEANVQFQCTDVEGLRWEEKFDCAVVFNAFPHFVDTKGLVEQMAKAIRPGGKLTIAHDRGIEQLSQHHSGAAKKIANRLISVEEMSELLAPYFHVTHSQSEEDIYIVSGIRI